MEHIEWLLWAQATCQVSAIEPASVVIAVQENEGQAEATGLNRRERRAKGFGTLPHQSAREILYRRIGK
jgi:hypothetical protein